MQQSLQFIMQTLVSNAELWSLTDGKYVTGIPSVDVQLDGTHKTIVGVQTTSEGSESKLWSDVRDALETKLTIQITVLTAYGTNNAHCDSIVRKIVSIFGDTPGVVGSNWRVWINDIKWNVKSAEYPGRWLGEITLSMSHFKNL